ncbi:MAG: ClbS/DfsB family four-helix bundle protein [Oscillospiraceae bacterium]|jgi:hypothetical protein|nr:ClbS/DfsB family four-helix bundle protein [Oscillospiraceae bacterium]
MKEYANKAALAEEIRKTAAAFIAEFEELAEADKDLHLPGVERSPQEMLAYQLGWMALLRSWDADELAGKTVITPAVGVKWNQMGALYQGFYAAHADCTLAQMKAKFTATVEEFLVWFDRFTEEEVFSPGGRKWASSTPSNWPIWKWVHINTAAPFKTFRAQIRKWKKLRVTE